jgi:hypothetical protein
MSVYFVVYRQSYFVNKLTPTKYVSSNLNSFSVCSQHMYFLRIPADYI